MSKKQLLITIIYLGAFIVLVFIYKYERSFDVGPGNLLQSSEAIKNNLPQNTSPISGLPCENYKRRPIAVMIANDTVARPLSGIGSADIVFEMQVIEDSITRLMAVFVCQSPEEIGSIRSARDDFIPLTMGLDAIYAHWGGSHFALDLLNKKIMDNIDALPNPYNAFYRKAGIYAPHNGFTSMERLINSATKLGYRLENGFEGYYHKNSNVKAQMSNLNGILKINYASPYNVEYHYDNEKNSYLRFRGGKPEIEKLTGQQVEAKNVVVLRAKSRPLEGQYNDVEIEGSGEIEVYQNGETIKGTWKKDKKDSKSKLYFYGGRGEEIKFVPGLIWVEIIEPEKHVSWLATSD